MSSAANLRLVRDGTLVGPGGTEIDFRTDPYDEERGVWVTIKADTDAEAEAVAAAFEAAFGGDDAAE